MEPVHQFEIKVSEEVLDGNRHVNNVAYVQWMQEAAIRHANITGCTRATEALGATWVARTHHVEYLRPAFAGDVLLVSTWVADFRKVRSMRKYRFVRTSDQVLVTHGETDWVFVDALTGRPRSIPGEVRDLFTVYPADADPFAASP